MKIVKEGIVKPEAKPWWAGRQAQCPACGAQVLLELGDDKAPLNGMPAAITVHAVRTFGGKQWIEGPCPTQGCQGKIALESTDGPAVSQEEFIPPATSKK